jgi:hypothetical protein
MTLHRRRDSQQIFDENSLAWLLIAKTEELRVRVQETVGTINERMRLLLDKDESRIDESVGRSD